MLWLLLVFIASIFLSYSSFKKGKKFKSKIIGSIATFFVIFLPSIFIILFINWLYAFNLDNKYIEYKDLNYKIKLDYTKLQDNIAILDNKEFLAFYIQIGRTDEYSRKYCNLLDIALEESNIIEFNQFIKTYRICRKHCTLLSILICERKKCIKEKIFLVKGSSIYVY